MFFLRGVKVSAFIYVELELTSQLFIFSCDFLPTLSGTEVRVLPENLQIILFSTVMSDMWCTVLPSSLLVGSVIPTLCSMSFLIILLLLLSTIGTMLFNA